VNLSSSKDATEIFEHKGCSHLPVIPWPSQHTYMKGCKVPSLFTLIRSCGLCISKSSGLVESFIQSLKEQQQQHILGPWSLR